MGNRDTFTIYIQHGDNFVTIENKVFYVGGNLVGRFGFDVDMFGYFDVEDEIKKLGYESWIGIWYKIPKSEFYKPLKNDKDVMDMLSFSHFIVELHKYIVDGGKKMKESSTDAGAIGEKAGEIDVGGKGENDEDWSSTDFDEDYCPSEEVETDDGLSDHDLASDDEEYVESRKKLRNDSLEKNDIGKYFEVNSSELAEDGLSVGELPISDYEDSDGEICSDLSEDEIGKAGKKVKKIIYDPKCDHKNLELKLGMRFEDGYQCREALKTQAIGEGWEIHFRRVSKRQCEARCTPPCPWRLYDSIVKGEETFVVKVLIEPHVCHRAMHNKLVSSKWIAQQYLNVLRMRHNFSEKDLRVDIRERFSCHVTRNRLYKAKEIAFEMLRGTVTEHYALLRRYIAELLTADREGRFELLLRDGAVFKGLYICFSSLRKGFLKGCRPIIGLDGAFLKTYLGGVLLVDVGKDGNNQMFPIAWAVVEVENEECWTWFIKILMEELGLDSGLGTTFISDQQKRLINAVATLAPYAEHRNCARHVYANWRKTHKGITLKNIFWKAVRSTYQAEYQLALEELKKEKVAAYEEFVGRGPQKFCKVFINPFPLSDMINNNISETFNGYILEARGKHVIHMCKEIRQPLMERQYHKREQIKKITDTICPNARKRLEKLKYLSRNCGIVPAAFDMFEIELRGDKFVVNVGKKSCTCREWDVTGIPCMHACAALQYLRVDPAGLVHDYYSLERYKMAYALA